MEVWCECDGSVVQWLDGSVVRWFGDSVGLGLKTTQSFVGTLEGPGNGWFCHSATSTRPKEPQADVHRKKHLLVSNVHTLTQKGQQQQQQQHQQEPGTWNSIPIPLKADVQQQFREWDGS
uniref:GG16825 n=1 Tax=Drosophila erecta TaxID=7220 RepID=B3P0J4_DROER